MELWRRVDLGGPIQARAALRSCCGSSRWVDRMMARRPFHSREAVLGAAREEWFALSPEDWREAFSHHPKIGDRDSLRALDRRSLGGGGRFPETHRLSSREQAGVGGASEDILTALAEGNRAYEEKFGSIFIVCATGKSAEEMLALLRARMANDPQTEIGIAAEEQAKITAIRLVQSL
jgi:2-oxo-4-hydroxy-4-carboxy-5-ureidoimidazoline decarboxylase